MKLTPVYSIVKTILESIPELQLVTWWNGQSAQNIQHTTPAAYIEFPEPVNPQTLGGGMVQQAQLTVRVTLISSSLTGQDSSINTDVMETHEETAMKIFEKLQKTYKDLGSDDIGFNQFVRKTFTLNMSTPGSAITVQDFNTLVYVKNRKTQTPVSASAAINMQ